MNVGISFLPKNKEIYSCTDHPKYQTNNSQRIAFSWLVFLKFGALLWKKR